MSLEATELTLEEGRSLRQIAKDIKRGDGTVYRAARRLGHGPGDPKLAEVIQNCDLGASMNEPGDEKLLHSDFWR